MTDSHKTCIIDYPQIVKQTFLEIFDSASSGSRVSIFETYQHQKIPLNTNPRQCDLRCQCPHLDALSVKVVQRPSTAPAKGNIPLARLYVAHKSKSSFADFSRGSSFSVIISSALKALASSAFLLNLLLVDLMAKRVYGTIPTVNSADRA